MRELAPVPAKATFSDFLSAVLSNARHNARVFFTKTKRYLRNTLKIGLRVEFLGIEGLLCKSTDEVRPEMIVALLLLAKEPVRCNGRENITNALNSTIITQEHNRSISFIFRGIIFVLPLILLLTLAGDGLGVYTKQQKTCVEYG